MAIKKYRLQRLVEGAETPDIVHLETSSDLVMQSDGTSLADGILDLKVRNSISMNRKAGTDVGKYSVAIGGAGFQEAEANDYGAFAFGSKSKATGLWSVALGAGCETSGGVAIGSSNKAKQGYAFGEKSSATRGAAIGNYCIATGFYGLAAGYKSFILNDDFTVRVVGYDNTTKTLTCEPFYDSIPLEYFKNVKISVGDVIAIIIYKGNYTGGPDVQYCNVVSIDYDTRTITTDKLNISGSGIDSIYVVSVTGTQTNVSRQGGIACGTGCISTGSGNIAMGVDSMAYSSNAEVAIGMMALSNKVGLFACGVRNLPSEDTLDRMIVGGGSFNNDTRSNCFRVTTAGVYAAGNYNASGADYAEMFEWSDGNPEGQDYVGRFVTLDGEKIRLAGPDDFILGVVSGNPSIVGDVHDDQWQGMFETDIFGRFVWEDVPCPEEIEVDGERIVIENTYRQKKLNPNYDGTQKYVPRSQRPEWATVGLMGKLVVNDDGTSVPNGYVKVNDDSIATASAERTKFRVMKRLDDSHIQILILG